MNKRQHWAKILNDQQSSGLTIAAFCRKHSLSTSLFYAWKKRLRPTNQAIPNEFVKVLPESANPSYYAKLKVRDDIEVTLSDLGSADALATLIAAIVRNCA